MKIKAIAFGFAMASMAILSSCSGSNKESGADSAANVAEFSENQPLQSGQYNVTHYDITGDNARKGNFDGRMLIALSPEQSALYVYENGNRAKIDYMVVLSKPFEKSDSAYTTTDTKGKTVSMVPDSVGYKLTFEKNKSTVMLEVDKTPNFTDTALSILEKIQQQKSGK